MAKSRGRGSFFADHIFASAGTRIALLDVTVNRVFSLTLVFLWMLSLEWASYANASSQIDAKQWAVFSQIKEPNLGELLPFPEVNLEPIYPSLESIRSEYRQLPEYEALAKIYSTFKGKEKTEAEEGIEPNPRQAYLDLVTFAEQNALSPLLEWVQFFRADMLMASQFGQEDPQLSLATEEYELATRMYPLSDQIPRALYQMSLIHLKSEIYDQVNVITLRGINNFAVHPLQPYFLLLNGEQFFRRELFEEALERYSQVVRRFPRSVAAIDAAFRRAFLLFRKGDYKRALETYQMLEKFHRGSIDFLKMTSNASSMKKFLDRIFYAETLFLTQKYDEASDLFQNLGNLFPRHELAPFIWSRYADTFLFRNKPDSAIRLYHFIQDHYSDNPSAVALGKIREADVYFLTQSIQSKIQLVERLEKAYSLAKDNQNEGLASLALAKLALHHIQNKTFLRAKTILSQYKDEFPQTLNSDWASQRYAEMVELEILDHYQAGDYLASLTVYLMHEKDESTKLTNVEVLLRLADAALELSLFEKGADILNRVIYLESNAQLRQEALLKLIYILIDKGDLKKASERLRRFSFAYPQTRLAYLYEKLWGDLYLKLDNKETAAKHYEDALKLASRNRNNLLSIRETYMQLGEIYSEIELPLKAIDSYERFARLFNDKEAIQLGNIPFTSRDQYLLRVSRYRVADIYFNTRDYLQALRAYRVVVEEGDNPIFKTHAQFRIGECYLNLNDRAAAIEAFQKVESPDTNNLWVRAAQSFMKSVQMEVDNGIRIFN